MEHSPNVNADLADLVGTAENLEHGGSHEFDLQDKPIGRLASGYHTFACVITISLMIACVTVEVFVRYFLGSALRWSQEVSCLCQFFLVIACQAHCWQKDRHIKMDMLYGRMPRPLKNAMNILAVVCGAIIFGALGYQSALDLPYQIATNEATTELMLPNWYISVGLLLGCALLFAMYLRWFAALFSAPRRKT